MWAAVVGVGMDSFTVYSCFGFDMSPLDREVAVSLGEEARVGEAGREDGKRGREPSLVA